MNAVDFGHVECVSLISSSKFQEKCVGYMAVSLLVKPGNARMLVSNHLIMLC